MLATAVFLIALFTALRSGSTETTTAAPAPTPGASAVTLPNRLAGNAADIVGRPLPALRYTTFGDEPASVKAVAGKPMVINFWSSTCAPCLTEMPDFERVFREYGDRVQFLGLDVQDSVDSAEAMVAKTGVTYPLGRDVYGESLLAVGGFGLPTTVLVDANGTVRRVNTGQLSGDDLTRAINQELLA